MISILKYIFYTLGQDNQSQSSSGSGSNSSSNQQDGSQSNRPQQGMYRTLFNVESIDFGRNNNRIHLHYFAYEGSSSSSHSESHSGSSSSGSSSSSHNNQGGSYEHQGLFFLEKSTKMSFFFTQFYSIFAGSNDGTNYPSSGSGNCGCYCFSLKIPLIF